jgi:hypothetical protein
MSISDGPEDTAEDREIAFENWLQRIPTRALKCRVQGHRFPDWDDRKHVSMALHNRIVYVEAECLRHCGVTITTFVDESGFLAKARKVHYYDPNYHYLMPKPARGRLTKERRAAFRNEFLERNKDWITQDDEVSG